MVKTDLIKLTAQELHSKGADFREQDKHLRALQYLTLAIPAYSKKGDFRGLVGAVGDRVLTWKHLFLVTKENVYRILALKDAELTLMVSEEYGLKDKLSASYFILGDIDMLFEDYPSAIKRYKLSLKHYRGSLSEKGRFRYHLGEVIYRGGEKERGKKMMLMGLGEIQKGAHELDPFLIHVWESGVHMRLAHLLKDDEPAKAKGHLVIAQKIADTDRKLVIRRRQIKELAKTFKN